MSNLNISQSPIESYQIKITLFSINKSLNIKKCLKKELEIKFKLTFGKPKSSHSLIKELNSNALSKKIKTTLDKNNPLRYSPLYASKCFVKSQKSNANLFENTNLEAMKFGSKADIKELSINALKKEIVSFQNQEKFRCTLLIYHLHIRIHFSYLMTEQSVQAKLKLLETSYGASSTSFLQIKKDTLNRLNCLIIFSIISLSLGCKLGEIRTDI